MLPDRSQPLRATAGSRLGLTRRPTRIKGRGRNLLARWLLRWAREGYCTADRAQRRYFPPETTLHARRLRTPGLVGTLRSPWQPDDIG